MRNYLSYSISIIFFLISFLIISCGSPQKEIGDSYKDDIIGFWERKGTIEVVNGIPVDTIIWAESDDTKKTRQVKFFGEGNRIFWISNMSDTINNPWPGGNGGYGKYKIHARDSLTEYLTNGTGWFGAFLKNLKDSLKVKNESFGFDTSLSKSSYSQFMGDNAMDQDSKNQNTGFSEYYEKFTPSAPKTKLDGVWKRVYEISYVNGIAVDTTSVPSDVILDIKTMYRGRFIYQVDQTGLAERNLALHGGFGGYGQFEYDGKGNLVEYDEFGSGNYPGTWQREPKTNGGYKNVTFYNDDLFLQIDKDTLNQGGMGFGSTEASQKNLRGLVYERIK